jgi:hypothetical protein
MKENLSEKIEEWRIVTLNHIRNIDSITKAHMIDMINNIEDEIKSFIQLLKDDTFIEKLGARANKQYVSGIKDCQRYINEKIDKLAGEKLR